MNGAELKAWRERRGLSQSQAGAALGGISRVTVNRYEAAPDRAVPNKVAAWAGDDAPATPAPPATAPAAKGAAPKARASAKPAGCPEGCDPAIHEALKRDPLFSLTAKEGKDMRAEWSNRHPGHYGGAPPIPLQVVWAKVKDANGVTNRKVNAAIPDPLPGWGPYGWKSVRTKSGAVYHYESAHRMG
jgi:transcriptional regulator with XRE-family HTH domain